MLDHIVSDVARQIKSFPIGSEMAIYTCCLGGVDAKVIHNVMPDCDCYFISDSERNCPKGWRYIQCNMTYRDPRRTAKIFKVLPHRIFSGIYSKTIWLDANKRLITSPTVLMSRIDVQRPLGLFRHNRRSSIVEESSEVKKWMKDSAAVIDAQIEKYRKDYGQDIDSLGLYSGSFIVREMSNGSLQAAMEEWWGEIDQHSVRDQLSLPPIIAGSGLPVIELEGSCLNNRVYETLSHSKEVSYGLGLGSKIKFMLLNCTAKILRGLKSFRSKFLR